MIWRPQRIIINPNAKVGKHCSISSGVVIAQAHNMCPTIGDNVELMIDCAVLGNIHIANNVRIGATTLVIKTLMLSIQHGLVFQQKRLAIKAQ